MLAFPLKLSKNSEDEVFMGEAIKEAWNAFLDGEVPVGAVLVHEGKIVSRGYNQVEKLRDGTAHAEILCLSGAGAIFDDWRLEDSTLYCTLEPCAMCAGAMLSCRIKTLVWGAPDIRCGANGSWIDIFEKKHPFHKIDIRSGIFAEECAYLMQEFFQQRR